MNKILRLLFFLALGIFPLGQLLRLNLPGLVAVLQPLDGVVFLFNLVSLGKRVVSQTRIKKPGFGREIFIFFLIAVFSLALKALSLATEDFIPALFYLLRLGNYFLFYFAFTDFFSKEIKVKKILIIEGLVVAVLALVQYLFLPDTRFLFFSGWDEHYFRAIGSFLDPAFTGIILCLSLWALITVFFETGSRLLVPAGLFLILAIGLTFSRISYLILFIGLAFFCLVKKAGKMIVLIALLLLFVIYLLPKPGGEGVNLWRVSSLVARSSNYQQVVKIIEKNFWLGVGFNAYRAAQRDWGFLGKDDWFESHSGGGADNSFLLVWATTGIFGFGAYLFLGFKIFTWAWIRAGQKKPLLLVTMVSLVIGSLAVNCLFYPWILFWLVLVLVEARAES